MTILCIILLFSLFLYRITFYKCISVLVSPSIGQLTFIRDYLLLTLIPYIYYYNNNNYKNHYILSCLNSNNTIVIAAIHALIFMALFIITYKLCIRLFINVNSKIKIVVFERRLLFYLNVFGIISACYFIGIAYITDASIFGIFRYNLNELNIMRAHLYQTYSVFFQFNKELITAWIPMLSYLMFLLYLTRKEIFNKLDKLMLIIIIFVSFLASIYYFEKSVIFMYLLGLFGIYVYAGNSLKKEHVLFVLMSAIVMIAAMYLITYQEKIIDNKYLMDIIIHRFMTQCAGSIMSIEYFSDHNYLGFAGVSHMWASAIGNNFQSVYNLLIDYYVPETIEVSGALSSFAVGDAYGLFGYFGVLISGPIVGIYYSFIESTKYSKFLSYIFAGLYGLYFSHAYIASGFYSFVWPIGFITKLFPFVAIVILSSRIKRNI